MAHMAATSWDALDRLLGDKNKVKVGNNTFAYRLHLVSNDGGISVEYHGHPIVEFNPHDRTVTLRDCGWQTHTTKERLNQFAPQPIRIWQNRGEWFWMSRVDPEDLIRPWPDEITVDMDGFPVVEPPMVLVTT